MMLFAEMLAVAQQIEPVPANNPLIDQSSEDAIYIGVGLIAIMIVIIVGLLSRRIASAVVFSVVLSVVIAIIVVIT